MDGQESDGGVWRLQLVGVCCFLVVLLAGEYAVLSAFWHLSVRGASVWTQLLAKVGVVVALGGPALWLVWDNDLAEDMWTALSAAGLLLLAYSMGTVLVTSSAWGSIDVSALGTPHLTIGRSYWIGTQAPTIRFGLTAVTDIPGRGRVGMTVGMNAVTAVSGHLLLALGLICGRFPKDALLTLRDRWDHIGSAIG